MSSRRRKSEPAKKGASRAAATRVNPTARLQDLKRLEVEAYCAVLSAFRAQGELTWKKESIMQDLRDILRISEERHRMEIKRVREDEALAEIAQLNTSPVAEEGDLTDTESPRSKKKQKQSMWGSNHLGEGLPPLDAVALAASTTPPNLSHIPSVDTKSRSKRTTSTSRKRKEPPKATKKEPKVEVTTAEEEEPELQPQAQAMDKESAEEKASSGEAGGEGDGTGEAGEDGGEGEEGDGALPMEASSEDKEDLSAFGDPSEIQQMQEKLLAEKERLRAELEALQAEIGG
ncbi:ENT domain-containing protein [Balamuthia mandrillaris]